MNGPEPDVGLNPAEKVPVYEGREQQTHGIQNPPSVNPEIQTCTREAPHACRVNGSCNGWPRVTQAEIDNDPNHVWTNAGKAFTAFGDAAQTSAGLLDGGAAASNAKPEASEPLTYEKLVDLFLAIRDWPYFPSKERR